MSRKEEFEALLSYIGDAPVRFAGDDSEEIDEEAVRREIQRRMRKLRRKPSLFSGDPEGFFTYDDPVLAITAYLYQSHLLMSNTLGLAGDPGESLRNDSCWEWLKVGVHIFLSRNDADYLTLMGMTPQEPIKIDNETARIAIAGDAGFSGQAQSNIIYGIRDRHKAHPFDLFIHLGDVYFAGHGDEFLKHLIAPFKSVCPRMLTLVGNHDLYFGGGGFISALKAIEQPGRYFSVETPHWRILCLDTALPAETLRRNSGLLDEGQLNWLDKRLETDDGKKTILMSHHYIVSAWGGVSNRLKRQMASRLDKIFAWYWGHEHSCAAYDKKDTGGFYGACIGNGAFLETWEPPTRRPLPQWHAHGRCSCYADTSKFWPHGYLELELSPNKIVENYRLENGESFERTLS
jgi:hypothetical protein